MTEAHPVHRWAVVIPSFNHADDAIGFIRSVWSARPRPGRLLLVDDASTDGATSDRLPSRRAAAETLRGRAGIGWAILSGTVDGLLNRAATSR